MGDKWPTERYVSWSNSIHPASFPRVAYYHRMDKPTRKETKDLNPTVWGWAFLLCRERSRGNGFSCPLSTLSMAVLGDEWQRTSGKYAVGSTVFMEEWWSEMLPHHILGTPIQIDYISQPRDVTVLPGKRLFLEQSRLHTLRKHSAASFSLFKGILSPDGFYLLSPTPPAGVMDYLGISQRGESKCDIRQVYQGVSVSL